MKTLMPIRTLWIILSIVVSLQLHALITVDNAVELELVSISAKTESTLPETPLTLPVDALSLDDGQTITSDVEFAAGVTIPVTVAKGIGTVSGVISGDNSILEKTGDGILLLSGGNTYTGGTTYLEGVVSIAADNNLGNAVGVLSFDGGILRSTAVMFSAREVTLTGAGTLDVVGDSLTMVGIVSGAGALTKESFGILTLSGENTYSGGTTLKGGQIVARNNAALGTGTIDIRDGTTLSLDKGITVSNAIDFGDAARGSINVDTGAGTLSGLIGGVDSILAKLGEGTLVLSGANTYSGGTIFSIGAIVVGNNAALGTGAVTLSDRTTLSLGKGITIHNDINLDELAIGSINVAEGTGTLSGVITGIDSIIVKTGAGSLTLSGDNTYSGGTTVSEGEIFWGHNGGLGTGGVALSNGTTLSLGSGITANNAINLGGAATGSINIAEGTGSLSGVISGTGSILAKTGAGILFLSGDNTYSGGTTFSEGEIFLGHSGALGTGGVALSAGTTLSLGSGITANNEMHFNDSMTGSINVATGTSRLSGVISGTGSILAKTGEGILTLFGENAYSGGTTLSEGEIGVGNNKALGTGAAALSDSTTLSLGSGITANNDINLEESTTGTINVATGTGGLSGIISGRASILIKTGAGVLALSGDNTYSGAAILAEGEISLGNNGALGTGAVTVSNGTTLSLRSGITANNEIGFPEVTTGNINVAAGTGGLSGGIIGVDSILAKTGEGALVLSGDNTYSGGTLLSTGEIVVDNNKALGTGAVAMSSATTLSLGRGITVYNDINFDELIRGSINVTEGTGTLSGVIGGVASTLAKTGAGILTLSGDNTYTGGTVLSEGEIVVGHNAALGTGAVTISTGTILSLGSGITVINVMNLNEEATGNINVAKGRGALSGVISGTGSVLAKTGAGSLILSGANAYSGGTVLLNGMLSIASDNNLGNSGGVTFNGGALQATAPFSSARNVVLTESGMIDVLGDSLTMSGIFSGAGSLKKTGGGILTLSGGNSYAGGTTLSEGELSVGHNKALGTGAAALSVGTTLSLRSGITANNDINFVPSMTGIIKVAEGTGTLSGTIGGEDSILAKTGAGVVVLSGVNVYSGGTTLFEGEISLSNNGALGTGAVALSAGTILSLGSGITPNNDINLADSATGHIDVAEGTGVLSGVIAGKNSILAKTGSGALALSGKNTYSGGTTLSAGEIFVGNNGALGTGALVMRPDFGDILLSLDNGITVSNDIEIGSLEGHIHVVKGTATLSGVIVGSNGSLVKRGAGRLILSGNNTYDGGTTIRSGELYISNAGNLGLAPVMMQGGTLGSLSSLVLPLDMNLLTVGEIKVQTGTLTLSGRVVGEGELVKRGKGTLSLTGGNTYSGLSTINAGIVELSGSGTLGIGQELIVNQGSFVIAPDAGKKTLNMLYGSGSGINLNNNELEIGSGAFEGVISGTGGALIKTSSGTLILSGDNTYNGGTTLFAGEVFVNNNAALGTGTITIADRVALFLDSDITANNDIKLVNGATGSVNVVLGTGTLSGVISGGGIFAKASSGSLALSGDNTYNGGTILFAGEISVGNNRALGPGAVIMSDGTTLALDSDIIANNDINFVDAATGSVNVIVGTGTLSGVIAGQGGTLVKTGAGTLVLSGDNTYTGGTVIQDGKLYISNANNLGSGPISIKGGVLEPLESLTLTNNIAIFGEIEVPTGTLTLSGEVTGNELVKTGGGTLSLAGDTAYSGLLTINAGMVELFGVKQKIADSTTLGSREALTIHGGSFAIAMDTGIKTIATLDGGGDGINLNNNILEVGSGSFAGDISGIGGGLTKTGSEILTLSGINTFTGDLSINQGELQIATVDTLGMGRVVLGGGILTPFRSMTMDNGISVAAPSQINTANGTNMTIAGTISGTSNLTKSGAGKILLTGNSATFTGTTTVQEGNLHVRGVLGGPVIVSASSILGGTGSVGTVHNSGTIIPGASIGTLSITGDYTQDAEAALTIEIESDPIRSDLLLITGSASLNGSLVLNPLPGAYEPGMVFTFLQANAVNGVFSEFSTTSSLGFELNYLSDAVQIIVPIAQIVLPVSINELNGNAKNVFQYLFSCPLSDLSADLDPIIEVLIQTSAANFPAALRQLGPQKFGSLALSNLQTSVRVGRSMNQTSDVYDNYYLASGHQSGTGKEEMFGPDQSIWFNPIGYYYKHNEVEEQTPFNSRTYGFTAGFRTRFCNHLIFSAGTGYTFSNLNWLQNNGGAHIQSAYLSPSIGYIGDYGYAGLVIVGSRSFYDVNRKIRFSTFQDEAQNKHKSYDLLAGFRGSIKLQCSPNNLFLLPTVNIDYLNIFESGYQESGGGAINLSVKNMHSAFLRPEVTLKLLKEWNTSFMHSAPSIYVGWLRNVPLSKGVYTSEFYKQKACEKNFTAQSYYSATDQLVLGAEVLVMYKANSSLKFGYEANIGNKYSVQEGKLNFNWAF